MINVDCIFCSECGNRIGWARELEGITTELFCDECKKGK